MQDSLPAAGPALPGGIGYPQGSCERFHGCNDSPFPSFLARCQFVIIASLERQFGVRATIRCQSDNSVSERQFGVSSSLLLPLDNSGTIRCQFVIIASLERQFGVSSSLLLPLHQVGKLDSWGDFQDRQALTLFTTRSIAGTTEPMSSAPTTNGICSLAISPAPIPA